jgi:ribonucleoside-triphosphate reductase
MIIDIIKRNGDIVPFDENKIKKAILSAVHSVDISLLNENPINIDTLFINIFDDLYKKFNVSVIPSVEQVQDIIERNLVKVNYFDVAKSYILYREQRRKIRDTANFCCNLSNTMDLYLGREDWRVNENSNVDYSLGGLILHNSGTITANHWLEHIYLKEISDAHKEGYFHIHDLQLLSSYCCGWSLRQLIMEGLGGVSGKISSRPARHLSTLVNQMVNFLGILQNEWAGAQAFSSVDTYLAPYVRRDNLTYEGVKQCIQSLVFGLNVSSRWGCVDDSTDMLTPEGFKSYKDLKEGDLTYVVNNGKLEIEPILKMNIYDYEGDMINFYNRSYSQIVTPNHRCLYRTDDNSWQIKSAEDIYNYSEFVFPIAPEEYVKDGIGLTDDEIRFCVLVLTEGSFDYRGGSLHKVTIYKSKRRLRLFDIEGLFDRLDIKYSVSSKKSSFPRDYKGHYDVNVYTIYKPAFDKFLPIVSDKKSISPIFFNMSRHQANVFINTWSLLDGNGKNKFTCQCDSELIQDQIQHIAILSGHGSKKFSKVFKLNKNPTLYIRIFKAITKSMDKKIVAYKGKVWCPTTSTGIVIFRSNGSVFISGNSQSPFTNFTFDWVVPNDLKDNPAIIGDEVLDNSYSDYQYEMDIINKAFLEVMLEGDAEKRGFSYPIPTYNLTKEFDWDNRNCDLLFKLTAKYGTPYFQNFINSDLDPSHVRSMCCRLSLDKRELRKRGGGLFGSNEFVGSLGVITLNMGRIGYLSDTKEEYFSMLGEYMDIAYNASEIKRKTLKKLFNEGLYPYTKKYLRNFDNYFSTIGLIGMNESMLNFLGKDISDKESIDFSIEVLDYMKSKLLKYQEISGNLYNLEATPGEGTSYRLAKIDKSKYPDIVLSGEGDSYYTNSTQLPVGITDDIFEALEMQNDIQKMYTGGTVFHGFLDTAISDSSTCKNLVRKIAENFEVPYFTITPTYSICHNHGYISGEQFNCPSCNEVTEVYSRIVGYYRPVKSWNKGKKSEYKERKPYSISNKECINK